MPRRPVESLEELRAALKDAVPLQHRARVAAIGRIAIAALEGSAPAPGPGSGSGGGTPVPGAGSGSGGGDAAGPPPMPQPPAPTQTFERILTVIRGELDRRGIELPDVRRRSRIPFVLLRPRQAASGTGDE